jgi:two-component system invasion response regulator UvrY
MTQVLIIDSQQLSRDALRRLLDEGSGFAVLASAEGYESSVAAVCQHEIDVVVVNRSGDEDVMETLNDLKQIRPGMRTLVLGSSAESAAALKLLEAGVDGYVTRDDSAETLFAAIRSVTAGERYVGPALGWNIAMNLLQAYPGMVLH